MDFRGSSLPAELDRRLLTRSRLPRFHETRRFGGTGRTARSRTPSGIPPLARGLLWISCVLTPFLFSANMGLAGESLRFREEFSTLDQWRPVYFRGIERHTRYTIETFVEHTHLKAESHQSASGLVWNETYSVFEYPRLRWRWKIDNVYEGGDTGTKAGDDYPLRIYVLFQYDPSRIGFLDRAKYELARIFFGEYPPDSTLNYVWANRSHEAGILTNPYSDRARMIPLRQGDGEVGRWLIEEVDVLSDYRRAFGADPPEIATVGIMSDSDDTGERVLAWLDFIEVFR